MTAKLRRNQLLSKDNMTQEQWLAWRRTGLGASDAPIIMEVSPWTTPFELWENKVFGATKSDNAAMKRGRDLEEEARQCFERHLNTIVFPRNVSHPDHDWLRSSLDGLDLDEQIMVEIKVPNKDDHFVAVNKKVPDKYVPQCQHQLQTMPHLKGMYYFSYDPYSKNGVVVEVARNDSYITHELFPKEKQFWDLVINQDPPELTARDKVSMEKNERWKQLSEKWKSLTKTIRDWKAQEESLREELIALSNERSSFGNEISVSKSICKGSIDYRAAIQEYVEDLKNKYPDLLIPEPSFDSYRRAPILKWTLRGM